MATYADNNATSAGYDQLFAWAKPRCGVCGTKLHDFSRLQKPFYPSAMLMVLTVVEIRRLFSEL